MDLVQRAILVSLKQQRGLPPIRQKQKFQLDPLGTTAMRRIF
jgi:hypothetical protein